MAARWNPAFGNQPVVAPNDADQIAKILEEKLSDLASVTAFPPSAASAAAPFARNHGTRLVDHQRSAHQIPAVASFDGAIGGAVIVDFDEPESASLASKAIAHHVDAVYGDTGLREEIRYIGFSRRIWKVSYEIVSLKAP